MNLEKIVTVGMEGINNCDKRITNKFIYINNLEKGGEENIENSNFYKL